MSSKRMRINFEDIDSMMITEERKAQVDSIINDLPEERLKKLEEDVALIKKLQAQFMGVVTSLDVIERTIISEHSKRIS